MSLDYWLFLVKLFFNWFLYIAISNPLFTGNIKLCSAGAQGVRGLLYNPPYQGDECCVARSQQHQL